MGCLESSAKRIENMPNVRIAGEVAKTLESSINDAKKVKKLEGYNEKAQEAKQFEGTSVKTLSGDAFSELQNQVSRNIGNRDTIPDVNPIRERMESLKYNRNSAAQEERGR